jgi:hypothetical protein
MLFADDVHAKFDAFIADENGRAGNQLADLMLRFSAERTVQRVLRVTRFAAHNHSDSAHKTLKRLDPTAKWHKRAVVMRQN